MKMVKSFAKITPEREAYRGKHVVLLGDKIVASGDSAYLLWKTVKKKYPGKRLVLAFVQKWDVFE